MSRSAEIDLAALAADRRVAWTEDVLRFGDTDANGHINNAAFAVFCESGRVDMLHDIVRPVRASGGFFVVAKLTIEFRAELHYPGRVRCGTWIAALGRSSLTFSQALLDGSGRLVATAEAVTVAMDGASRRPTPLDAATRAAVEPLLRPPGEPASPARER